MTERKVSKMNENTIRQIVAQVVADYGKETGTAENKKIQEYIIDKEQIEDGCENMPESMSDMMIPVEVSARHVHLSREDAEKLFGKGYQLKKSKDISQPGQFLSEERISLIGPKGRLDRVAVLGPFRDKTQIEISLTDSRNLGIKAPVRMSGDLEGAAGIYIMASDKMIHADEAAIVAQNHLHMTTEDAVRFGLKNKQKVKIKMNTVRPLTFENVTVRVSDSSRLNFHIDHDEANACGFINGDMGIICIEGECDTKCRNIDIPVQSAHLTETSYSEAVVADKPQLLEENDGVHIEGKLLTERKLYECHRKEIKNVTIGKNTIITPMAKDYAREKGIEIHYI